MPTTSAMRWLVGLTLVMSGCMIWDDEISRATAGGLLSKPVVRATLSRHREWVVVWGESETWHLNVEIDARKYEYGALEPSTEVRISPDRKQIAVRSVTGKWRRFAPGTTVDAAGVLSLEPEGEPLDELTWPADHQQPVPDCSWLAWSLAALTGLAAGVLWLRWRARKRAARPAEQPPASS